MTLDTWGIMDQSDKTLADTLRDPLACPEVHDIATRETLRRILLYLSPETPGGPGGISKTSQDTPRFPHKPEEPQEEDKYPGLSNYQGGE